jgi:2-hydroxycyclohexanecarboxyl-CoA dehydrogenase
VGTSNSRVALVTGAGGGMGSATVLRLVKDGFRIAGFDANRDTLSQAMDQVDAEHSSHVVDMTDEVAVRHGVAEVEAVLGRIDVLVNLIGWCETHPFVQESSDYWRTIIDVNFLSILFVTHAVLPAMIEGRQGKLVNVSSDAARVGQSGEAVYAGAKGAVISFTKSLARELARYNITANCTAPGPTDTPLESLQDPDSVQRIIRHIPFRRMARPEEQADAIAFLCSPAADYITGQVLSVSGGLTMC